MVALLDETPDESIRNKPCDQKPYWVLERSRIEDTRKVPVELDCSARMNSRAS